MHFRYAIESNKLIEAYITRRWMHGCTASSSEVGEIKPQLSGELASELGARPGRGSEATDRSCRKRGWGGIRRGQFRGLSVRAWWACSG